EKHGWASTASFEPSAVVLNQSGISHHYAHAVEHHPSPHPSFHRSFYLISTMKMLADFNKGSFIAHVNVHSFPFLHLSYSPLIDAFFLQR
ncbi:MAG: hypothetical protein J6T22_15880, partial [Bacteroidales bacterium]|nr:hypothetical protein [Bacteroidales bacterium]